jgi:hypothetical protein
MLSFYFLYFRLIKATESVYAIPMDALYWQTIFSTDSPALPVSPAYLLLRVFTHMTIMYTGHE